RFLCSERARGEFALAIQPADEVERPEKIDRDGARDDARRDYPRPCAPCCPNERPGEELPLFGEGRMSAPSHAFGVDVVGVSRGEPPELGEERIVFGAHGITLFTVRCDPSCSEASR